MISIGQCIPHARISCLANTTKRQQPPSQARATADVDYETSFEQIYSVLASLVAPDTVLCARTTDLGRGLVPSIASQTKDVLLAVDWMNILCISDEPSVTRDRISKDAAQSSNTEIFERQHPEHSTNNIVLFGERCLEDWQAVHGNLPTPLANFLVSDAHWASRLAAWLLWIRRYGNDVWKMYCSLLPRLDDMTCLMNYDVREAGSFQFQHLIDMAERERETLQQVHRSMFDQKTGMLGSLKLSDSFEDTLWAFCIVNSRCFSDTTPDGENLSMMVPCADMANHSNTPDMSYRFNFSLDRFELGALSDFPPGAEVCISYGCIRKNNAELMRDYGFFLPGNLNDRIPLVDNDDVSQDPDQSPGSRPTLDAARLMKVWNITAASKPGVGVQLTGPSSPAVLLADDTPPRVEARRRVVTLLSLAGKEDANISIVVGQCFWLH